MIRRSLCLAFGCWLAAGAVSARDLYVDPDRGSDSSDGTGPLKSIARAVALVGPGDTIHLAPRAEPYPESIDLRGKSGAPGNPFVIDGHGATLTGAEALRPADWVQTGPGLYRSDTLYKALKGEDFVLQRIFFLFNGRAQHMGRSSKGTLTPFKASSDLQPGEWTFEAATKAFYLRIDPDQTLAAAKIEIPFRANGVATRGNGNAHFTIRNLVVTHFYNDGFNLHGECSDARFENIGAYENGDDGFSAHEACETTVDGYWALRNSTGVANAFDTTNRLFNAYLGGNYGCELMGFHSSVWEVRNVAIDATAQRAVVFYGNPKTNQICRVSLDNVDVRVAGGRSQFFEVLPGAVLRARRLTTVGLTWHAQGEAHITESALVGPPRGYVVDGTEGVVWQADTNVYALARFRIGENAPPFRDFEAYRQATGQDANSRCLELGTNELAQALQATGQPFPPAGAARAEMRLPKIPAGFLPPEGPILRTPPPQRANAVGQPEVSP